MLERQDSIHATSKVSSVEGLRKPEGRADMAMTEERVSEVVGKQCYCEGRMVRSALSTNLSVRHAGESSSDYWSSSKLDSYTCVDCGRTELFAENPSAIA